MNAFSVAFGGKADMPFCTAHVTERGHQHADCPQCGASVDEGPSESQEHYCRDP